MRTPVSAPDPPSGKLITGAAAYRRDDGAPTVDTASRYGDMPVGRHTARHARRTDTHDGRTAGTSAERARPRQTRPVGDDNPAKPLSQKG